MEIERGVHIHKPQFQKKESRFLSQAMNSEDIRKQSSLMLSPRGQGSAAGAVAGAGGSSTEKTVRWRSCLCSPTNHPGSFRCRFHRSLDLPRGASIGSNLSELANKSGTSISDSGQA